MTPDPRISVLVISNNVEAFIEECITSLINQTLRPCEIIISDDLSTDNTRNIITALAERYPDLIIPCLPAEKLGPAQIGNAGMDLIRGDWICAMDGDDRWHPEKLEKEFEALQQQPGAEIAYSNVQLIDEAGRPTQIWHNAELGPPPAGNVFKEVFSRQFFNNTGSVFRDHLVSVRAIKSVGFYYDVNINCFWDWDEKIRLTAKYPVAYSGGLYVDYRIHPGGISHDKSSRNIVSMINVYKKNMALVSSQKLIDQIFITKHVESAIHELGKNVNKIPEEFSYQKIIDRIRHLINQIPLSDKQQLYQAAYLIRSLYIPDVAEKILNQKNDLALESWINYLKKDVNPIDLQLCMPAQLHNILHQIYKQAVQNRKKPESG